MNKRYAFLLVLSAAGWFLVAGVFGCAIPVFGSRWVQHLVCAVLTSFVVGVAFRAPILRWSGWRWYVLPLLTLLTGTSVFGLLLTGAWALSEPLDTEAFYQLPLAIVFHSMTFYLAMLYPLGLLTQHLLRAQTKSGPPGASPNGVCAILFSNSGGTKGPPSVG